MNLKNRLASSLLLVGLFSLATPAAADCCGPTPQPPSKMRQTKGWSGFVTFERMEMKSLLRGTEKVSPDLVLTERLQAGADSYSVPTDMLMDRATLQLSYRFDENHALRVSVPWRGNRMDMRMASVHPGGHGGHHGHGGTHHRSSLLEVPTLGQLGGHDHGGHDHGDDHAGEANHGHHPPEGDRGHHGPGSTHHHGSPVGPTFMDHPMDPVDGLGDIALNYTYAIPLENAYVYMDGGVQIPTGRWNVRDGQGELVHNMMQPGTGALGLTAEVGAEIGFGDSNWSLHPRVGLLWTAPNPLGYQRGSRFEYGIGARYQPVEALGLGLDFTGFTLGGDTTNGTIDPGTGQVAFQQPETSLVDDVRNTGGQFLFLAPSIQVRPSEGIALGFQYRLPIYQRVKGTQLGIDTWYRTYLSARF